MVEVLVKICEKHEYIRLGVFQGQYNVITRGAEKSLCPVLRRYGIAFYAYSILGGGFLTGAFSRGEHQGTRFDSSHALGSHFQKSFGSDELSQAMAKLEAALKPHGIVPRDAGMRWAAFHSALEETDGIIIRASKLTQLDGALETLRNGPLPVDVVATINGIWRDLEPSRANIL
ncbi:MAG: hypothetical protein MMC23_000031 [Stictis urceolatum]|nr:hypothetical protein [Stictis urceolata]